MDDPAADAEALTPLDPDYQRAVRVTLAAPVLVALAVALLLEVVGPLPTGAVLAPVVLVGALLLLRLPRRRWRSRGYQFGDDRLRVVRGVWVRRDVTVPFGRVQHIDVEQGPVERMYGLGTLVLHTAGNHNASVELPGLRHGDAVAMREAIRAHVTRAGR